MKGFFIYISLVSGILFFSSTAIRAQKSEQKCWFDEAGFATGFCFVGEKLPEGGEYKPLLLLGQFTRKLGNPEKPRGFEFIVEPQFNPVSVNGSFREADFGMNLAIRFRQNLWKGADFYTQIGTGPHYITIRTSMQAHGYIFSDNLTAGFHQKIGNGYTLLTQLRFRHISNANLMKPNLGIDNFFVIFGISKSLSIH